MNGKERLIATERASGTTCHWHGAGVKRNSVFQLAKTG
jgi:hypothetical protein